jgi:hypothetical protein
MLRCNTIKLTKALLHTPFAKCGLDIAISGQEIALRWALSPGLRNDTGGKSFRKKVAAQLDEAVRNGDIASLKELL